MLISPHGLDRPSHLRRGQVPRPVRHRPTTHAQISSRPHSHHADRHRTANGHRRSTDASSGSACPVIAEGSPCELSLGGRAGRTSTISRRASTRAASALRTRRSPKPSGVRFWHRPRSRPASPSTPRRRIAPIRLCQRPGSASASLPRCPAERDEPPGSMSRPTPRTATSPCSRPAESHDRALTPSPWHCSLPSPRHRVAARSRVFAVNVRTHPAVASQRRPAGPRPCECRPRWALGRSHWRSCRGSRLH